MGHPTTVTLDPPDLIHALPTGQQSAGASDGTALFESLMPCRRRTQAGAAEGTCANMHEAFKSAAIIEEMHHG